MSKKVKTFIPFSVIDENGNIVGSKKQLTSYPGIQITDGHIDEHGVYVVTACKLIEISICP